MPRRAAKKERQAGRHTRAGKADSPGGRAGRRVRVGPVVLLALVVAAGIGVWQVWRSLDSAGSLGGRVQGFNLLLITLDTTRADCLGCYGHPAVKTPNIDALAREGVRFTQCTSAAPITLPSHASIMTATYPFVHRARNNGRYLVDEGNITLAELLQAAGYATGAQVGAFVLDAIWGIDQGFDSFRSSKASGDRSGRFERLTKKQSVPADDVCDRAVEWLERYGSQRFFLWVHFFDPHQPCKPPERFRVQYDDPYFGEIAFVDEQVGRLMDKLRGAGLDDRTLVVLTTDHGEGRGEHKELTHVYYVYDSTMRVPLIFWCPGVIPAGGVIDVQVRTVDIAPTALALLGLEPMPDAQGQGLLSLIEGAADDPALAAYGESVNAYDAYGYARLRTLRADGWKYIHAPKPELYDARSDPGETVNLADRYPERVASMQGRLEALIAEAIKSGGACSRAVQLDATSIERLSALGYVGGYAPTESKDELQLFRELEGPDPKDHISAFNQFLKAQGWAEADEPAKAETILRKLIAAEPKNPAFRSFLADQLRRSDRLTEAAEQYEVLLGLQPDNGLGHYRLGNILGKLGRLDESAAHLGRAADAMPEYPEAHAYFALALKKQGKWQEAERQFRVAVELDPRNEGACTGLSAVLYEHGRMGEAVQVLQDGWQNQPASLTLANNLAWYLATCRDGAIRDGEEAVRVAQRLCRNVGSDNPAVLDTLAAAYAEAGRLAEAVSTARRAAELADEAQLSELHGQIESRAALYEAGQAYREGS